MGLIEKILGGLLLVAVVLLGVQTFRLSASQHGHERDKLAWKAQVDAAYRQGLQEALAESETARETERIANQANQRVVDELQRRQADTARALTATTRQLRDAQAAFLEASSEATRAASAQCRSLDAPAVAVLPDETQQELVEIAHEADVVSNRLLACQRYVNEVIGPYLWTIEK